MKFEIGTGKLLVAIIIIGVALRLFLGAFTTMPYDMSFWAGVMNGFNNGEGLYESEYYWYTPTWGYILALLTPIMNALDINIQGFIVTDLNNGTITYVSSVITVPAFNLILKLPIMLCDFLIAILLLRIVKKRTDDDRKATFAFGLWFLCPLVLWNSAVQGQFDSLAILGMMLSVYLIMSGKYALSGAFISFATITKMFPAIIIPLLIGYVIAKSNNNKSAIRNIVLAVISGAAVAFAILLPVIISGDIANSMLFLTDRMTEQSERPFSDFFLPLWGNILTLAPIIIILVLVMSGYLALKKDEDIDARFLLFCTISSCILFTWPNAPPYSQYVLLMLPFLIITNFNGYDLRIPYILTSVLFTTSVMILTGPGALYPLSYGTGIISPETLAAAIDSFNQIYLRTYGNLESLKFVPAMLALIILSMEYYLARRRESSEDPI